MSYFSSLYQRDLQTFYQQIIPQNSKKTIINKKLPKGKYDYIVLPNTFAAVKDVQLYINKIKKNCYPETKIIVVYFNFLWKPFLSIASFLNIRKKDTEEPNWLSSFDIENLFHLEGFRKVKSGRRFIPFLGKTIPQLPLINNLCLTTYQIFKPGNTRSDYSVSIIIPARNEEGNMKGVLNKIPNLGRKTEVIFVEGHSTDNTYKAIQEEIKSNKTKINASLYKQKRKGKEDAVDLGFRKATNDILMILDADLTVPPRDLKKFYSAISMGYGDFINGSRLVYPMENQAMRTLNYLGNKCFSLLFSYLLGQPVKDTLCGTKVLFRKDYFKIRKLKKEFEYLDPFGDFDLLFGATKLNLKIVEIPVRYKERTYGTTNIKRFKNGWQLIKMTIVAARKIKFI